MSSRKNNPKKTMDEPTVCHLALYILECAPRKGETAPCLYIGQTRNVTGRFDQHFHRPPVDDPSAPPTGRGSQWTKLHAPRRVVFLKYKSKTADESLYTLACMHAAGDWTRVRGAQWSKAWLRSPPRQLSNVDAYAHLLPSVRQFVEESSCEHPPSSSSSSDSNSVIEIDVCPYELERGREWQSYAQAVSGRISVEQTSNLLPAAPAVPPNRGERLESGECAP